MKKELKSLIAKAQKAAQRYVTHAFGQVTAWYTIATHDLSKWESAGAAAGALALTSFLKKVQGWLGAAE